MRSTGTADLLRSHLALFPAGLALHGLAAIPASVVALAPAGFAPGDALPILLPALLLAAMAELPLLVRGYRPVAALDTLTSDGRYAQNPVLAAGVIRLLSMPVRAVARIALVRTPVFAAAAFLLAASTLRVAPPPSSAREFWLLHLTLVPLAGAALEFFLLPEFIARRFGRVLSYRSALRRGWQGKIRTVPTAVRLAVLVIALAVVPMLAVGVGPERTMHTLVLGGLVLVTATLIIVLMARAERRSVRALLEAMHQIVHHRGEADMPVFPADAHTPIVDGFSRMAADLREQTFIRDTFGKHVPRAIVEAVLRDGIRLQGERRDLALLLVEMRDVRTRLTNRTPAEIVAAVNEHLGLVIASAQHYGGTIDRVIGDRVLVGFGAPVQLDAPADRALHAALDMRRCLERENAQAGRRGAAPRRIAVSIHYGTVVAGHIGAAGRWEYTYLGDGVDEVHAVAGVTLNSTADIIVSEHARRAAGPEFRYGATAGTITCTDGSSCPAYVLEGAIASPASSTPPCVSS